MRQQGQDGHPLSDPGARVVVRVVGEGHPVGGGDDEFGAGGHSQLRERTIGQCPIVHPDPDDRPVLNSERAKYNGAKADGRMAAVGMVWNAGDEGQVRYVYGLAGGLSALGEPLRRQAGQVGMDRADRWVTVSDGGSGIEDWLRAHFPRVEAVILDFYHAAEHPSDWAEALHPDADEATAVATTWCHRVTHEGGAAVPAGLRGVDVSDRSAAVREAHRQVPVFLGNQVHRMDYPTYRAEGWLIGSGPVGAACEPVVGQRLNGTGMRWSESGADAVCHVRALFRGEKGQWDAYWASLAA